MLFKLKDLPFEPGALVPCISRETIDFHYGKHHLGFVNKLNSLVEDTEFTQKTILELTQQAQGSIFNNAAQIWNHDFYWQSLSARAEDHSLNPLLQAAVQRDFGSLEQLIEVFNAKATSLFGSGWVWLIKQAGRLSVVATGNADTPVKDQAVTPLLVCDLWEHAYYIDYRNDRAAYLDNFWQIVNWRSVGDNFA